MVSAHSRCAHAQRGPGRLRGDTSCIAETRHLAADFLARARARLNVPVTARAINLIQLVVSELVTNACAHAPGPAVLELRVTDTAVEVSAQDSVPVPPTAHAVDPRWVGRHGVEIVQALAEHFHVHLRPSGKRVTARIALTD
ncbi:ATP-binding protein [Streptomyces sp. BH-SS-21]|uniref:ATP-binding protein n=1 Tax=Streptomyces liliiviolaceus TaxID=2823109 RepID=A0A941B7E2_9ACTN|nr:ATP-binding protein [Streptomyces liliiviolaceus]MBQ0850376.1 ATP-binding protein [Streptomyces liliiviolaceus]